MFDKMPKMIIIIGAITNRINTGSSGINFENYTQFLPYYSGNLIYLNEAIGTKYTTDYQNFGKDNSCYIKKSDDQKTIYWYSTTSDEVQYNQYYFDSNNGLIYQKIYYYLTIDW